MSLGYQRGNSWVVDDVYARYSDWDAYHALIRACREAGFTFSCKYSHTARRYEAEIITIAKIGGSWYETAHGNAFHENPMIAIVYAIRRHHHNTALTIAVCLELEVLVLREKLLPRCDKLSASLDDLVFAMQELAA
jgi:hypothetical protein